MKFLSAFLALVVSTSALAAPLYRGQAIPMTETRYGVIRGKGPLLGSNGQEPVLFWSDGGVVRASRSIDGQPEMAWAVLPGEDDFDAVWTGSHFVAVSSVNFGEISKVVVRILSPAGEPVGDPFLLFPSDFQSESGLRLALTGGRLFLLYSTGFNNWIHELSTAGVPAEGASRQLPISSSGKPAVASNGATFAALYPHDSGPRLLLFNSAGEVVSDQVFGTPGRSVALAADGERYLGMAACVVNESCSAAYARVVQPDGTLGAPQTVGPAYAQRPSAAWNGDGWVVSFIGEWDFWPELNFVRLDAAGQVVAAPEIREGTDASLAFIGGRALVARVGRRWTDTIYLSGLPLDDTLAVSRTALPQKLLATASSSSSTLFVWQEKSSGVRTLYSGVRAADGRWSERLLGTAPMPANQSDPDWEALAAGGPEGFAVVIFDPDTGQSVQRLATDGTPIGAAIDWAPLGIVTQILWDGDDYLLFNGVRSLTRLSPAGIHGSPVEVSPLVGEQPRFASDGNGGLYAVWTYKVGGEHAFPDHVAGLRLGTDFQAIDAAPQILASGERMQSEPSVAWDGRNYAVTWMMPATMALAQVPPGGTPRLQLLGSQGFVWLPTVTSVPGGVALLFQDLFAGTNHLVVIAPDGTPTPPVMIGYGLDPYRIVTLPDGDFAAVSSVATPEAPLQHVGRVLMTVASLVPMSDPPPAPHTRVQVQGETVVVSWDAPFDPVNGYRVELRKGDGPWLEVERVFGPDERSAELTIESGKPYTVRVRAWNESGMGAYSVPYPINAKGRRRAVR